LSSFNTNSDVKYVLYFYIRLLLLLLLTSSLVTGLFFLVLLLNQRWSAPLRLQASHCSTFRIMCDVPSIAVFCSESIECFPVTASSYYYYYYGVFFGQSHTDSASKEIHTSYGFHSFIAMFTNADHYLVSRATWSEWKTKGVRWPPSVFAMCCSHFR
jgi:hypothetical protein